MGVLDRVAERGVTLCLLTIRIIVPLTSSLVPPLPVVICTHCHWSGEGVKGVNEEIYSRVPHVWCNLSLFLPS